MKIPSKPDYGSRVLDGQALDPAYQRFFDDLEQRLNDNLLGDYVQLPSYTVATLPAVAAGGMIYVSDETGGAVVAFGDGTNWRRVTDRAIVS